VRELRRADVLFSAPYLSFVLAPWPAVTVARLFGKPVSFNYRSGEALSTRNYEALYAERGVARARSGVVADGEHGRTRGVPRAA
jgi:hypothetical protein